MTAPRVIQGGCVRCGGYLYRDLEGMRCLSCARLATPQEPVLDIPKPVAGGRRTKYGDKERV